MWSDAARDYGRVNSGGSRIKSLGARMSGAVCSGRAAWIGVRPACGGGGFHSGLAIHSGLTLASRITRP